MQAEILALLGGNKALYWGACGTLHDALVHKAAAHSRLADLRAQLGVMEARARLMPPPQTDSTPMLKVERETEATRDARVTAYLAERTEYAALAAEIRDMERAVAEYAAKVETARLETAGLAVYMAALGRVAGGMLETFTGETESEAAK